MRKGKPLKVLNSSCCRYVNHHHGTEGGQSEKAPLFLVHDGKETGLNVLMLCLSRRTS